MLLEFDVVGIFVTFNLTGLLPSNHIIAYITMVYRSLWGTARCWQWNKLKQRKLFKISLSESRIYKKWQTSAIIREISDSNLETGRNSSKSRVSRIIRESWQPSTYYNSLKLHRWQKLGFCS